MIVDRESFTELAVHLKLASDAILRTARHLAVISSNTEDQPEHQEHWRATLDSLTAINTQITLMEKLLRAILEANKEEGSPGQGFQS